MNNIEKLKFYATESLIFGVGICLLVIWALFMSYMVFVY
jgi:hypothetical protein